MHLVKMHYVSSELKVGKAEIQTKRKQNQKTVGWFLLKRDQRVTLQQFCFPLR